MGNFKFEKDYSLTLKSTYKVIKKKEMEVVGIGTIPMKIEYDLENIPKKYHEACLSMINHGM